MRQVADAPVTRGSRVPITFSRVDLLLAIRFYQYFFGGGTVHLKHLCEED
jgi:hypothetical protein